MLTMTQRFVFLSLTLFLFLLGACSGKPESNATEALASASSTPANANSTAPDSGPNSVELAPVMPEKVQVAFERSCKSCHGPEGQGITNLAPDLRRAPRRGLANWVKYLKDEKGAHSSAKIPAMASLTDEDYEAIGAYLADLTQNNALAPNAPK